MTVPATTRKAGPYTGTGVQTVFPFSFKVFAITDVKVVVADTGGNESTLSSGYTVTVNADQVASPGGSVTLSAALASGYKLSLLGNLPYDQTLALPGGGNFNPVAVENALDRIVEQVQQISEAGSRVLALPATANASGTLPAPAANKVIGWNATGDALQNLDAGTLATVVAFGTANADIFTGTGAQTVFTLSANPGAQANLDVSVGGVTQYPGFDYSWSGGTSVTFTVAPPNGVKVLLRYFQGLPQGTTDSAASVYTPAGTGAAVSNVQTKLRESPSVVDQGAVSGGSTAVNDAAFAKARAITNRYYIPSGIYALSASPDPFLDCFTSGSGVTLVVGGVSYDCSNAFAGPLRYVAASATKTNVVHAKTGNVIQYWQDGAPGTATGFYRGLAFTTDSHFAQAQPATNGGSTDLLFQRSTLNADPAGNRFNITFEETGDRLLFSYATTASGAPSFDTAWAINAGTGATMTFPGLQAQFNQGVTVKQRAAGGFVAGLIPTSSTVAALQQVGGSATNYMNFRDGAFGFFGSAGTSKQTITGSRGGNAALASLLTALANTGLITDSTTA